MTNSMGCRSVQTTWLASARELRRLESWQRSELSRWLGADSSNEISRLQRSVHASRAFAAQARAARKLRPSIVGLPGARHVMRATLTRDYSAGGPDPRPGPVH